MADLLLIRGRMRGSMNTHPIQLSWFAVSRPSPVSGAADVAKGGAASVAGAPANRYETPAWPS